MVNRQATQQGASMSKNSRRSSSNQFSFTDGTLLTHNGKITVSNVNTGQHRTFKVNTQPQDARFAAGKRVVSLFVGQDNQNPFEYKGFGFVNSAGTVQVWRRYKDTEFEVFGRMLSNVSYFERKGAEYLFSGRCIRCNRELTNPDSIRSGIGPVCAGLS
jgi:hypothetical protein